MVNRSPAKSTETRRRNRQLESKVEKQIIDFLGYMGISCWSVDNHGKMSKSGFYNKVKYGHRAGIPDIHGFLAPGVMLFLEVKSETGRVSKPQIEFLNEAAKNGHFTLLARSWIDVREALIQYFVKNTHVTPPEKLKNLVAQQSLTELS